MEKAKAFDANLGLAMTNLTNGRVRLNFTNQFQCKKIDLHCIVTLLKSYALFIN